MMELLTNTGRSLAITLYLTVGHHYHHCQIWFLLSERSINQIVLIKACEINLLHVSHVENILQEGKMTEHVLVWHLYRERSLSSNALHLASVLVLWSAERCPDLRWSRLSFPPRVVTVTLPCPSLPASRPFVPVKVGSISIPCRTIPFTIPCNTRLYFHTIPCNTLPCHTMSYQPGSISQPWQPGLTTRGISFSQLEFSGS